MTRRRLARTAAVLAAAAGLVVAPAAAAGAHPLGNFTRNVYAGVILSADRVRIDHVVDFAEIPAFQERQRIDTDGGGTISGAEGAAYRGRECQAIARQVRLSAGGAVLDLRVDGSTLTFPPGAGGLPTLRLECRLSAPLGPRTTSLTLDDETFAGRLGWHEITAVGDGATLLAADVPITSVSHRLTAYPADLLTSPLQRTTATLRWAPGGPRLAATTPAPLSAAIPAGVDAATRAFTDLIGRRTPTLAFTALALLLAVALGAMHALAPGHGKTLMAGYLVGVGGRVRDAVTIGAAVTITHTAGVLVLGLVLVASAAVAPETVYPWMGLASGLLAVGIGVSLLRGATRRRATAHRPDSPLAPYQSPRTEVRALARVVAQSAAAADVVGDHHDDSHAHAHAQAHGDEHIHDHAHDHAHSDGHAPLHDHESRHRDGHARDDGHDHAPPGHRHGRLGPVHTHAAPQGPVTLPGLISLGLAGGMVPSPSALVVLLAGFAQHRAWFGLTLVIGYGIGMALALTTIGLLLVRARRALERLTGRARTRQLAALARLIPVTAAIVVLAAGGYLALSSLRAM